MSRGAYSVPRALVSGQLRPSESEFLLWRVAASRIGCTAKASGDLRISGSVSPWRGSQRDFHVPGDAEPVLTASIVGVQPGITLTQRLRRASISAWVCFPRSNSSACAASIPYPLPYNVLLGSAPEDAAKVANELIGVQVAVELAELLHGCWRRTYFGEVV